MDTGIYLYRCFLLLWYLFQLSLDTWVFIPGVFNSWAIYSRSILLPGIYSRCVWFLGFVFIPGHLLQVCLASWVVLGIPGLCSLWVCIPGMSCFVGMYSKSGSLLGIYSRCVLLLGYLIQLSLVLFRW